MRQQMMEFRDSSGISWTMCKQSAPHSKKNNHANASPVNIYRIDSLHDAKPTVSKH